MITSRAFATLACLYLAVTYFAARPALHDESNSYYSYGRNFLATGVYGQTKGESDNYREPGYGVFLAAALLPVQNAELATQLRWIAIVQSALFLIALVAFLRFAALPLELKSIFTLLALVSPTLWGAHSDIYSETIPISIAVVFLTLFSRADFARPHVVALASVLLGWLSLTKLYLMYLFPVALLALLSRKATRRLAIAPVVALAFLACWSLRSHHVDRFADPDHRTVLQLAGKVYRPELWNLREEWRPALLASCCLNTCTSQYGAATCGKFSWTVSDNIAYALIQDWKDHPEKHEPNLLHEVLHHWLATLPMQLVGSGLELLRMMFFEAPPVWPDSPGVWRVFAQIWHLFGSLLLWAFAAMGAFAVARSSDPGVRRAGALAGLFLVYHFLFMAQVTNVQRYTQPVIPYLYFFVAASVLHPRLSRLAGRVFRAP
jgi:hypothetical protein